MLIMATMFVSMANADENIQYSIFIDGEHGLEDSERKAIIDNYVVIINFANSLGERLVTNDEFETGINEIATNFSSQKKKLLANSEMKNRKGFKAGVTNLLIQDAVLDEVVELNTRYFNTDDYEYADMLYSSAIRHYGDAEWNEDAVITIESFCEEMVDSGVAKPNATGSAELCSPEYLKRIDTKMKLKAASALTKMKIRYLGGTMEEGEYFDHEEEFQKVLKDDVIAALNK